MNKFVHLNDGSLAKWHRAKREAYTTIDLYPIKKEYKLRIKVRHNNSVIYHILPIPYQVHLPNDGISFWLPEECDLNRPIHYYKWKL